MLTPRIALHFHHRRFLHPFVGGLRNESEIRSFITEYGPISTAIDASFMQTYVSGVACPGCVIDDSKGPALDHAVLFVGWGTDNGKDYWIIKPEGEG